MTGTIRAAIQIVTKTIQTKGERKTRKKERV
jgi:hypothetical protein